MATKIDGSAHLDADVELDDGVEVGPFSFLGAGVRIGSGTRIMHHASVVGQTELGCDCEVFPYACLGEKSQDLKFRGGATGVRIGSRNVFREFTTVHAATDDGEFTTVGDDCLVCAYSHIAHDCRVGDHLVMSSHAALGGHVMISDGVNIGWNAGIHQFCRVGAHAMVSACSKLVQDMPPFMICDGNPAEVRTINRIGLQRKGWSDEEIGLARTVFRTLYRGGLNRSQAMERLCQMEESESEIIQSVILFVENSDRGLA